MAARPHVIRGTTPMQLITIPSLLSYWLNDKDGDCVAAEEALAKAIASIRAGQMELFIQDATVLAWATKNGVLNGANLDQVLQLMTTAGFQQDGTTYDDGPASAVEWTDQVTLANAISLGPVKLGVAADQLEDVVGTTNGWFGVNFKQTSEQEEDHCIGAVGFGPMSYLASELGVPVPANVDGTQFGVAVGTWKTIGILDWHSFLAITWEAWLRDPTTVTTAPNPVPPPKPRPVPPPAPPHHHPRRH